jgi:hypothetical protein
MDRATVQTAPAVPRGRPGRWLAGVALMSIWVVLPLLPALGVLLTWWLGISE